MMKSPAAEALGFSAFVQSMQRWSLLLRSGAAEVGIAMEAGTKVAVESAGLTLLTRS